MKYTVTIDDVNMAIAVMRHTDGEACLEYANKAMCDLFHFSLVDYQGIDGESILNLVRLDDQEAARTAFRTLTQEGSISFEVRSIDSVTGLNRWLSVHGSFVRDHQGTAAIYACQDITELKDAAERERALGSCLRLITTDSGTWQENLHEAMEHLRLQYHADRSYIFEFDWPNDLMSNTFEVVGDGVSPEIDMLQNLPTEMVNYWLPYFRNGDAVFIDDLEAIKDDPSRKDEYDVLAPQDIHSLMVVPIIRGGNLFGYVGVDNPAEHKVDKEFLVSIAHILSQEYLSRMQKEEMRILSLTDPLTKLNNRHAFNMYIDSMKPTETNGFGVVFSDVNGLKYINDNYGHVEGDHLIQTAAALLVKYFSKEHVYRISGDEFVCIVAGIDQATFEQTVKSVSLDASSKYGAVFSIGSTWKTNGDPSIALEMVNEAEELMYQDKQRFYEEYPLKARKTLPSER